MRAVLSQSDGRRDLHEEGAIGLREMRGLHGLRKSIPVR